MFSWLPFLFKIVIRLISWPPINTKKTRLALFNVPIVICGQTYKHDLCIIVERGGDNRCINDNNSILKIYVARNHSESTIAYCHKYYWPDSRTTIWSESVHCSLNSALNNICKQLYVKQTAVGQGICYHYADVIMATIASQITRLTVVYSTVYSDAGQRKHQSSASLAFVWGIHRDRWIPRTKGLFRGKCFHLMTSSWIWLTLQSGLTHFSNAV